MSLLEDARRVLLGNVAVHLIHDPERGVIYKCLHCPTRRPFGDASEFVHGPDCPTRSLPRIVAALEAVQTFLDTTTVRKGEDGIGWVMLDAGFLAGLRRAMRNEAANV